MTSHRLLAALAAGRAGVPVLAVVLLAQPGWSAPTRSSHIAVSADGHVFVVNPDSNSVARLEFNAMHVGTLTNEQYVGSCTASSPVDQCYPRTVAVGGSHVYTANQNDDSVSRFDQADLGGLTTVGAGVLGTGCNPYGIAATSAGDRVLATCQGTSQVLIFDASLGLQNRITLAWPNARAIAISSDGNTAYVTHYLTEEPSTDAHVSKIDLTNASISAVFAIPTDTTTCETQNSGQGPLNEVSSIALIPDGAPAEVAGQLWVGGEQENNLSKGLFKREPTLFNKPGAGMFPWLTFTPFPDKAFNRNVMKASFHDIIRFGIYKLDANDGHKIGKIDVDEATQASDIQFSLDGSAAYVVDQGFNSYHVMPTVKGQRANDVTTIFASPSSFGPGGGDPSKPCVSDALRAVTSEKPFRIAPEAQIVTIDGIDPADMNGMQVSTGVDFDTATYMNGCPACMPALPPGSSRMISIPDGIGTVPMGVGLSPDGTVVYVANYLSRNVVPVAAAFPLDAGGKPQNLRCSNALATTCGTSNDCPAGAGFCNHPGGGACTTDADCGGNPPCVQTAQCVPLVLGPPVSTLGHPDPLPPAVLDGKILFNTAARDSSVPNGVGLDHAAPPFNDPTANAKLPGSVVSTSHDASYVTCQSCHSDFGGQDGRTWDFSQLGVSLRNTMDLRGRSGFAPGHCDNDASRQCTFDATCGDGHFCKADPENIPPNVTGADRDRYFNPMLTVHWNGDRDEVEDFEHTFRSLMGAGDCDSVEDTTTCMGALVQRSSLTSTDPVDVNGDECAPNRNLRGQSGKIVGIRLTHMADFVYSLTEFVKNPNQPDAAAERGRQIFNAQQTQCTVCHLGGPFGKQYFTDKKPLQQLDDPSQCGGPDHNNPFLRHNVGTANLFDETDPFAIAQRNSIYQNPRLPIPGHRDALSDYVTPTLVDVWNTAPYLHDGSAHALLDVIRPCDATVDDCLQLGRGRNISRQHGVTDVLTPQQLNDLVAFQKSLTVGTVVGGVQPQIVAGNLELSRVVLTFPKRPKKGHVARAGRLSRIQAQGVIALGANQSVDPRKDGVTLQIATPAGEQMAIVTATLAMKGGESRLAGRASVNGGELALLLRRHGRGSYRFTVSGKRLDFSALDTGNRDLTLSLQISGTNFVGNRNLVGKANVFKLPPKHKRKKK